MFDACSLGDWAAADAGIVSELLTGVAAPLSLPKQRFAGTRPPECFGVSRGARRSHLALALVGVARAGRDHLARLRPAQRRAAEAFLEAGGGMQLLQGPPGTGPSPKAAK